MTIFRRVLLLIIVSSLFIFGGCGGNNGPGGSNEGTNMEVILDGLPSNYQSYYIVMQAVAKDSQGNYSLLKSYFYENISSDSSLTQSINIPGSTYYIGFYLFQFKNSYEPTYFYQLLYQNTDSSYHISYWLRYFDYWNNNIVRFGISKKLVAELTYGTPVNQDFTIAPYFLYKLSQTQGKSLAIDFTAQSASLTCNYSNNIDDLINGHDETVNPNQTKYIYDYKDSELYFLLIPSDYGYTGPSSLLATDYTRDYQEILNRSFVSDFFELGSDHKIYLTDQTNNSLRQWDIVADKVQTVASFASPIKSMVLNQNNLYIGESARLWQYNIGTGINTHKYNAASSINCLYSIDNYLICNDSPGGSFIRLSDFVKTDSGGVGGPSKTFVNIPGQNRVYILRDGTTPNDLCYLEYDLITEKFGTYDDSPYHGEYSFIHPLKQFDDELKVLSASGRIFDISSGTITYHSTLGYAYNDLVFYNDKIYVLNTTGSKASLMILNKTAPHSLISIPIEYSSRVGKRLLIDGNSLIIITQALGQINRIWVEKFSFADLDGLIGSTQLKMSSKSFKINNKYFSKFLKGN